MTLRQTFLVLVVLTVFAQPAVGQQRLICCGGDTVYILDSDSERNTFDTALWKWTAKDSAGIAEEFHDLFRSTDDCKPLTESILITSSGGGVAVIRRADKRCLFLANAKNAHSACIVPPSKAVSANRIVVASSFGGDELLLYIAHTEEFAAHPAEQLLSLARPSARLTLKGAHGALWDEPRKRIWALGSEKLCLVDLQTMEEKSELKIESEFALPSSGGHDLTSLRDGKTLIVTTDSNVYRFDMESQEFVTDDQLGNETKVKSVTENPTTGEIAYQQATADNWWSDTIRFIGSRDDIRLPERRLYKVRWDLSSE